MRIDVHTHVFNLRSIPARGVLRRWNVPDILARAAAKLFLSLVQDDPGLSRVLAATSGTEIMAMPPGDVISRIAAEAPPEILLDEDFRNGLLYIEQADVAQVVSRAMARGGVTAEAARATALGMSPHHSLAALNLAMLDRQARFDLITLLLQKLQKIIEGGAGAIRFLYLLTRSEAHILDTYRATYQIDLNVHLMMDLELHYLPDPPVYDFVAQQIPRMRELANQSGGRLVVFAAFDPYREKCQEIIESAIEKGCIGVKFYPPSGYRPSGNKDGTYDGPPAWQLDARNDKLFEFCANNSVPVFTHCTPSGFTAAPGYGEFADPKYWAPVLAKYPTLILGFGHSGGAEGWFAPLGSDGDGTFENSFAGGCFALMKTYDNVYLDFGYLDDVFDAAHLERIRARIASMVISTPKLGERFMYGSDWHMLYKEAKSDKYLDAFEQVFTGDLEQYRDRFFGQNAARYLRLQSFAARNAGWLSAAAAAHLQRLASEGVR